MRIASSRALYRAMAMNTMILTSRASSILLFPVPCGDVRLLDMLRCDGRGRPTGRRTRRTSHTDGNACAV